MTDDQDATADKHDGDESKGPVGGERLAAARREQQISVLEVAKELHLDEPKVRALERNDFDVLGAPVFAKGHLRKYAQLVGVNDDDVFADYYQLTRAEKLPPIVIGRKKARHELSPGPWIAVIIVVLAAAAAYWWMGARDSTPAPTPVEEPEPASPLETATAAVEDDAALLATTPSDEATGEPAGEPASDAAGSIELLPEPAPEEALADGEIRLALAFNGDCWTEISDGNGRRLYFGMGRDGRSTELTGPAPFTVLLGNADNVELRVNGSPYSIPASSRDNRTARLTILQP